MLDFDSNATPWKDARRIELAPAHGDWVNEIDIGHFLAPHVRELAARLVAADKSP